MATRARSLLAGYAELLGICAVGITQPVLDTFGDTPEQFAFRGATARDIIVFPLLVAFVPAAVLWLPGVVAGRVSEATGRVIHLLAIGTALFVSLLQVLHALGVDGILKAVLAAAGACGGAWIFGRVEGTRLWARIMSVFALAVVGLFLFSSPAGELAFDDPPETVQLIVTATDDADPGLPDIMVIVLDELPTALLLDETGVIDPLRYPNLAAFAGDATWYRGHTTVSPDTVTAVPAILTGELPTEDSGPTWTDEPDNLFRLLGGTYHLAVSEALTRLCPLDWCGRSPVAPPPETTTTEPADIPSVTTPIDRPDPGGLSHLLRDAFDLWTDQIALDRDDEPVFTGFEETAVVAGPPPTTTPPTGLDSADLPDAGDEERSLIEADAALEGFFVVTDTVGQLPRVDALRATIAPSSEPTLWFLHLVLPHSPFVFTETGAPYAGPVHWDSTSAEWDETILAERLALQMQFTDRLVGDLLDDLRSSGIYDDALVVVTGDHGANLDRMHEYRVYDGANASGLMVTPLLIKTPRQVTGTVSDAPVESIDVLPTIADVLGVEVPWQLDGTSVLDVDGDPLGDCEDVRRLVQSGGGADNADDDETLEYFELCADEVVPDGLVPLLGAVEPTDEWATSNLARRTPFPELLGISWDDLGTTPGDGAFILETADVRGGSSPPVGVIEGRVVDPAAEWVAVSLDGIVAAISPVYDKDATDGIDRADHFTVLVPSPLLDDDGYEVRLATLETVDGELRATALRSGT